ncbi:MAG: methyl-accepting chemotaxis protein [Bryobacteraceae bacterium]|jgi:methyl-accepting chemotaxis protein
MELAEEVAGHWPHLPSLEGQIRETIQQMERAVTDVCGAFEGMAKRARESVAASSRLLGSDKGSGIEGLLAASRHTLGELQQQIERGQEISAHVIGHMQQLESTAGIIVKALAEIDRISFGSKLVALNAKVEAAHFGEQGGAFGVVADEIAAHALRSEEITAHVVEEMKQLRATVAVASSSLTEMARMSVDTLEASRTELESSLGELTRTHGEMEATLAASVAGGEQLAGEIARSVVALQFQDSAAQRLSHVADELAEMRKTVHLPLEYLARETPVLGEARRKQVGERLAARYTMQAERKPSESKPTSEENEMEGVELF